MSILVVYDVLSSTPDSSCRSLTTALRMPLPELPKKAERSAMLAQLDREDVACPRCEIQ